MKSEQDSSHTLLQLTEYLEIGERLFVGVRAKSINKVVDWYSLCSDAARHGADWYLGEADLHGKLFVSRCRQVWAPRCLILPRLYSLNSGAEQVGGRLSSDTRKVKCPIGRNGQINSVSSIYLSNKAIRWG